MASGQIPHQNDISCASPEGSDLSISLVGNISISPTNEFREEIRKNVSANLQTPPRQKQGKGKELGNRKNRGKPTRRNRFQRWYKQKNLRISTNQRKFGVADDNVPPTLSIG